MKNAKYIFLLVLGNFFIFSGWVFAAEEINHVAYDPYRSISAALAISIAVVGGAFGQSKIAATALEGIARNPAAQNKIFIPMIIGLALVESLVLYAFVVAFIKI